MSASESATAAWIGPLPPPVHGASLVTARLLERVRDRIEDVRVVDVAGKGEGLRHVVSRARAHLRALGVVLGLPAGAVVYVSLFGGFGLWYQLPVLALARARGLRVVAHHHSYAYITARAVPMVLITRLLGRADRHLFLSTSMRTAFLRRYASRADHRVASNAHVVDPCPARQHRAGGGLALVHVSNLSVSKGSVAAIATCEALRRRRPDVGLTLVGPCGDDETATAIDLAAAGVRWLGPCSTADVNAALDDADVFLFPSSYVNEAEPLVVLEALSRGVPVIATRRGALPELLPADWLVDGPDPEAIAARVEALCSSPTWRADADPVSLVLEKTSREVTVLQVAPTFHAAALAVSGSYTGAAAATLCTVGSGRPGPEWAAHRTVSSRSLRRWLVRHVREFDLVHVHGDPETALLARLSGRPYVFETSGPSVRLRDGVLEAMALRRARAVRVANPAERERVLAIAPQAVVVVSDPRGVAPVAVPAQRATRQAVESGRPEELVEG